VTAWLSPPAELVLGADEVHVWRAGLVQPPAVIAALAQTLSDDERARAARFHFERDRSAYTVARGALRSLIGRYLGLSPDQLVFGYRDKGKPYLASPQGELRFNVSHSGGLALLAFVRSREIGVDIEQRRQLSDLVSLARTSFSPNEYAVFSRLPTADHVEAFFSCWSRKEAFIKATGEGVSQLADFDVSLAPGEPAQLLRVPGETIWWLQELPGIRDYAAAVVVEGGKVSVGCWEWMGL